MDDIYMNIYALCVCVRACVCVGVYSTLCDLNRRGVYSSCCRATVELACVGWCASICLMSASQKHLNLISQDKMLIVESYVMQHE